MTRTVVRRRLATAGGIAFVVACAACGSGDGDGIRQDGLLRVDGRSDEAFAVSMRRIKDTLTSREQSELTDAILRVLATDDGPPSTSVEAAQRRMRERLHGMSVGEILAAGKR